jgi:hypothetical protein
MIASKYILYTYYVTYNTLYTKQIFVCRGYTIMRVPRVHEYLSQALWIFVASIKERKYVEGVR